MFCREPNEDETLKFFKGDIVRITKDILDVSFTNDGNGSGALNIHSGRVAIVHISNREGITLKINGLFDDDYKNYVYIKVPEEFLEAVDIMKVLSYVNKTSKLLSFH